MAVFLRIVRGYAIALWVGGLVFFVVVAGIAFKSLPDAHTAGIIVRNSLLAIHDIGLYAAVIFVLATLGLLATARDRHPLRIVEIVLAAFMFGLTLYSQLSILPRMETDRLTLGGDVTKAAVSAPAHADFDHLHTLSVRLESIILVAGLVLLALAPIQGRNPAPLVEEIPPA
jgi:hypothetical protein